jgi:predicted dehydrogenase
MGHHHAEAALDEQGVVLAAGCDVVAEQREAWGERFGVPAAHLFERHEVLLERADLDVVIVSTHATAHAAPAIAAAKRGVHVLCEKPPAMDLRAAAAMVAACRAAGVKLAVNHIKRGSAGNEVALRLIRDGAIGTPYLIRGECKGRRWAGSELMEMGTHLFDLLRLVANGTGAGDPAWRFSHLVHDGREARPEDAAHALRLPYKERDCGVVLGQRAFTALGFPNGLHAEVHFLHQPQGQDAGYGFDVVGTEGTLELRRSVHTELFIHHAPPLRRAGRPAGVGARGGRRRGRAAARGRAAGEPHRGRRPATPRLPAAPAPRPAGRDRRGPRAGLERRGRPQGARAGHGGVGVAPPARAGGAAAGAARPSRASLAGGSRSTGASGT